MSTDRVQSGLQAIADAVLDFWFAGEAGRDLTAKRKEWFVKDDGFDRQISAEFSQIHAMAATGDLNGLLTWAEGCLALTIILDQFPRNMFRNKPRAYATDALARTAAHHAIEQGYDTALPEFARMFLYLPFEHSESIDDQERCVKLFTDMGNKDLLQWAVKHRDIVAQFGRFPHRNEVLERDSTTEELAFLEQPGSSF